MLNSLDYSIVNARRVWTNDRILIFGGTGSLGGALIRRFISMGLYVVAFSRDEAKHWMLKQQYASAVASGHLTFIVGDVRDPNAVKTAVRTCVPHHIIIASALKQVDTCENQPSESIATNILGVQNVVDAVNFVDFAPNVCFVSTDKACSPINVYGMCKAVAERLVTADRSLHTRLGNATSLEARHFVVRYGNVLDSRGSIIPLFQYQSKNCAQFTLTHPDMTRFLMTLDDSVDLIIDAMSNALSGDVWIPQLSSMRIIDLANIFAEKYSKPVKIVGIRPGEKLHETLINDVESQRMYEVKGTSGNLRYVLHQTKEHDDKNINTVDQYTSADDVMSKSDLEDYLNSLKLI